MKRVNSGSLFNLPEKGWRDTARKMNIKGDFTGDFRFFLIKKRVNSGS